MPPLRVTWDRRARKYARNKRNNPLALAFNTGDMGAVHHLINKYNFSPADKADAIIARLEYYQSNYILPHTVDSDIPKTRAYNYSGLKEILSLIREMNPNDVGKSQRRQIYFLAAQTRLGPVLDALDKSQTRWNSTNISWTDDFNAADWGEITKQLVNQGLFTRAAETLIRDNRTDFEVMNKQDPLGEAIYMSLSYGVEGSKFALKLIEHIQACGRLNSPEGSRYFELAFANIANIDFMKEFRDIAGDRISPFHLEEQLKKFATTGQVDMVKTILTYTHGGDIDPKALLQAARLAEEHYWPGKVSENQAKYPGLVFYDLGSRNYLGVVAALVKEMDSDTQEEFMQQTRLLPEPEAIKLHQILVPAG